MSRRATFCGVALATVMAWHALATAVAPYPGSGLKVAVYPWFETYLQTFYLEHDWRFFGPEPAAGRLLRAHVTDGDGRVHELRLSESAARSSPLYFRYVRLWDAVGPDRPHTTRSVSLHLCRIHADLEPRSVQLVRLHQLALDAEQYRNGLRPLDPLTLRQELLAPVACPASDGTGGSA